MKTNNWKKTLNVLISGMSCLIVALLLAINLINPIPTVKASLTKDDILKSNINFIAATTDIRQIIGFESQTIESPDGSSKYYDYIYNYQVENFNYYSATSSLPDNNDGTSGKLEKDPMVQQTNLYTDSSKVQIEVDKGGEETEKMSMYAMYDYASKDSDKNDYNRYYHYGYIPTDTKYFQDADGTLQDLFYNEVGDDAFVLLQNDDIKLDHTKYNDSTKTEDPINVSNFYLNFGSAIIDETNPHTPLAFLQVSGKLYNSEGAYNLDLNNPLYNKVTLGNSEHVNYYWYHYFDLNSIRVKENDDSSSRVYTITNTQGKYVINFTFLVYLNNGTGATEPLRKTYTYTFYLLDESTYASYPTLTEDAILGSISDDEVSSYFYNFSTDTYPQIEYFPNIYSISVEREYDGKTTNISSNFSTSKITHDDKTYHKALISYYDDNMNLDQEITILSYTFTDTSIPNQTTHYSYYLYLLNTTGVSIPDQNLQTFNDYNTYINNGTLDVLFKVVDTITIKNFSYDIVGESNGTVPEGSTLNYTLFSYKTYKNYVLKEFTGESFSNWYTHLDTNNPNEKVIKEEHYIKSINFNSNSGDYTIKFYQLDVPTIEDLKDNTTNNEDLATIHGYAIAKNVLLSMISSDDVKYQCDKITIKASTIEFLLNLGKIQTNYYYSYNIEELGSYNVTYYYLVGYYNSNTGGIDYLSSKGSTITVKNYNISYEESEEGEVVTVDKSHDIDNLPIASTNGYTPIEAVTVDLSVGKVYIGKDIEKQGSTAVYCFSINKADYSTHQPIQAYMSGNFSFNPNTHILYCVASTQQTISDGAPNKGFKPALYRYNTTEKAFDIVIPEIGKQNGNDTLGAGAPAIVTYDINTEQNVYTIVTYSGSSYNNLTINFKQLGFTTYSDAININTNRLAWNYDLEIDTANKTLKIDAKKDITVFKISRDSNATSSVHTYDSQVTNNNAIIFNTTHYYNYVLALNDQGIPCIYRISNNSLTNALITLNGQTQGVYTDEIDAFNGRIVLISYVVDANNKLNITFKVCKSTNVWLQDKDPNKDNQISTTNAIDISRIEITQENSNYQININDYNMYIFILNAFATNSNDFLHSSHMYSTSGFQNNITYNANSQIAYAILKSNGSTNLFRYNNKITGTNKWVNVNLDLSNNIPQLKTDRLTIERGKNDEVTMDIVINYTFDTANEVFTSLSFSKLVNKSYSIPTASNTVATNVSIDLSDTFVGLSDSNFTSKYYTLSGDLNNTIYISGVNGGYALLENGFKDQFDRLNSLYTVGKRTITDYYINTYSLGSSMVNDLIVEEDPNHEFHDINVNYPNYSLLNKFDTTEAFDATNNASKSFMFMGVPTTFDEIMTAVQSMTLPNNTQVLTQAELPTITSSVTTHRTDTPLPLPPDAEPDAEIEYEYTYTYSVSYKINGTDSADYQYIYFIKPANQDIYYAYYGSQLNNIEFKSTDTVYVLSSGYHYEHDILRYNISGDTGNTVPSVLGTQDGEYIAIMNAITHDFTLDESWENNVLDTATLGTAVMSYTPNTTSKDYYLNYTPSIKMAAIIVDLQNNTQKLVTSTTGLINEPYNLVNNSILLFSANALDSSLDLHHYRTDLNGANLIEEVGTLKIESNKTNHIVSDVAHPNSNIIVQYTSGSDANISKIDIMTYSVKSTEQAGTGDSEIETRNLIESSQLILDKSAFTMSRYKMLIVEINRDTNEINTDRIITTFTSDFTVDINSYIYYAIAKSNDELYIYKLVDSSGYSWARVGTKMNTSSLTSVLDNTEQIQITYNFSNLKLNNIAFTAIRDLNTPSQYESYYASYLIDNSVTIDTNKMVHYIPGSSNIQINTTSGSLTVSEDYTVPVILVDYDEKGIVSNISTVDVSKGNVPVGVNQKLYVILNTTSGDSNIPALFPIKFNTTNVNDLQYKLLNFEQSDDSAPVSLASGEYYYKDDNLLILYKQGDNKNYVCFNIIDLEATSNPSTNFASTDFNPTIDKQDPQITIGNGIVQVIANAPISFVLINKKDYRKTEIFALSKGSFEFNSSTHILYTFRLDSIDNPDKDDVDNPTIQVVNLYRYDYVSTDVFPFKKITTLESSDSPNIDPDSEYNTYCDIDYYEDLYTIVSYKLSSDHKLIINFAKLYPAFVNIGGYFSGSSTDAQTVTILDVVYSYTVNSGLFNLIVRPDSPDIRIEPLNSTDRTAIYKMTYEYDGKSYDTYIQYTITLDTTGVYLNVKYVLGYMEIYEGKKQSTSNVGGSNSNPEYGSITETIVSQRIHNALPNNSTIAEFNNLIRYIGTDLSSTENNLVQYYTSEITAPIESSINIDIFGLKNYYNQKDSTSDNGFSEMNYKDVNNDITYTSDVTSIYVDTSSVYNSNVYDNTNPISEDFLSEILGDDQISVAPNGTITVSIKDIDKSAPFTLENLIITNVTPTYWTYLCDFLYDSSNRISQSIIYKYDYDLVYDEWGSLKQLSYNSSEYTSYYLTKDTEINDDGLYQIIVKYTYDKYTYLDEHTNVIDGSDVVFYQLFTFIVNNNTPTLTISVGNDETGYNLIGTSNYTNKNVMISWVATTIFQNYEYITITNTSFNGTTNFVATFNPKDMSVSTNEVERVNAITDFVYDSTLKSYVVYIDSNVPTYNSNGYYRVRLHYGVNQSSYSTYEFIIDTEQISGISLYSASEDENGLYYTTENLTTNIVNTPFTLTFNRKNSGAKISASYYKLTLNQTNDYQKLLNTIIDTKPYTAVTTDFLADGTLTNTNQNYIYNYLYTVENVGDYISSQCYMKPSKSTVYMFYLNDTAGNFCRYFVFYDTTTPKYIISPELQNEYNLVNDTTSITWGDYKAIKIKTPANFPANFEEDYLSNNIGTYDDLSKYTVLESMLMYINSSTSRFKGTLVKKIDNAYYLLVPLRNKVITNDTNNSQYVIEGGLSNTSTFYTFTSIPNILYVHPTTGNIVLDVKSLIKDVDYVEITNHNVSVIHGNFISISYVYLGTEHAIYGAYGEHKFYFTINDAIGNNLTNFIWMNFDQTQGFAWASFSNAVSFDDINYITPDNTYSAAQLYFSAIVNSNIPDFKISYSYYDFEYKNNDLYSNYYLSNATTEVKDVSSSDPNRKTVTILNLEYTHNTDPTNKLTYPIEISYTDKFSTPGNVRSFPIATTSYPFSLSSTTGSSDLFGENLSNFTSNDDRERIYSNMINPVYNTATGTSMTAEGLYIFKREYSDIRDLGELDNDTLIKYYIYYIDRTGIINLSASLDSSSMLSNMVNFTLGSGQNASYTTEISSVNISTNATSMTSSKNSNSVEISNNLFTANKVPIQLNIPVDKYNFSTLYNRLLRSNPYNLLDETTKNILNSTIYNSTTINKNFTLNIEYLLGNKKLDTYTTYQGGTYTLNISDNAGYDYTDTYGNLVSNYLCNRSTVSYTISHSVPTATAYGKYYGQYDYIDKDNPNEFTLLSNYFANGNLLELGLDVRGNAKESNFNATGSEITLYNTNNESLIFIFSITNDKYKAQIDPNNLTVFANGSTIFSISGGTVMTKNPKPYMSCVIDGVKYYAIVVYDNNLDGTKFEDYRLLDSSDNPDTANYTIVLRYVGRSDYYVGDSSTNNSSKYYSATYNISVDRTAPKYNLTKLMAQDRYYNDEALDKSNVTASNYESMYDAYFAKYNPVQNVDKGYISSDLENYFFAADYRQATSFSFDAINSNDSSNNIYFRYLGTSFPKNYAQTITPDKYNIYYDTTFKPANPRFVLSDTVNATGGNCKDQSLYYSLYYSGIYNGVQSNNSISLYNLTATSIGSDPIMYAGAYYEIIEVDEANNYQVYGIYLPKHDDTSISYLYKPTETSEIPGKATPFNSPQILVQGFNLRFSSYTNDDSYLKAKIVFSNKGYNVRYNPYNNSINTTLMSDNSLQTNYSRILTVDESPLTIFRVMINTILSDYHTELLASDSTYTVYGYTVTITIVDRIGIYLQGNLHDYVFTYVVSGSVLDPIFEEDANQNLLYVTIPKITGSTYIKYVEVYRFDSSWISINTDYNGTLIDQSPTILQAGFRFRFSTGMYKFVTTDNFDRKTTYFYQYGLSDTHTGGSLGFTTPTDTYENDNYTYTSGKFTFAYDNSMYGLYIRYLPEGNADNQMIELFNGDRDELTNSTVIDLLATYYITLNINGNTTTLTFDSTENIFSRFIIKTVFANLETNYIWDSELTNSDIVAYTHKIALYTYIPNVIVKNLTGSTLDTSSQLSLTEDFTINISWLNVNTNFKYNFSNQIFVERDYLVDGTTYNESYYVSTGYTISEPGNYTAYVINSIGQKSASIRFSRSKGEILLYAVYTVSGDNDRETKLVESNLTNTYEGTDKINYNFYTLNTYLNYKNKSGEYVINQSLENPNFDTFINNPTAVEELEFSPNEDMAFYVDVRTNSNMGILAKIVNIGTYEVNVNNVVPIVTYKIYTMANDGVTEFIYRYLTIYFLNASITEISDVEVYKRNGGITETRPLYDNSSTTNSIRDTSEELVLYFDSYYLVPGNINYVDYYLNGELVETIYTTSTTQRKLTLTISDVGIHRFVIRDLSGHTHSFYSNYTTLYIYLINSIMYEVNDETPINYQIFNGPVNISISDTLVGIGQIYDATDIGIKVYKNGAIYTHSYENKTLSFTEPGHYSVHLDILTSVSVNNSSYNNIDKTISANYNFIILNPNVAQRTFSIPKSYNFTVEKFMKDNLEFTDTLEDLTSVWLSSATTGAGIYEITVKTYLSSIRNYKSFTFKVWISEESPSILGSVPYGQETTSTIQILYNPGLIYTQIGNSYIAINNEKILDINASSINEVLALELGENLTYYVQIFNADGQLISSYKFIKKAPLDGTAQFIIFIAIAFVIVVVIAFIILRRKAKIR